jgi:hypothetical protein
VSWAVALVVDPKRLRLDRMVGMDLWMYNTFDHLAQECLVVIRISRDAQARVITSPQKCIWMYYISAFISAFINETYLGVCFVACMKKKQPYLSKFFDDPPWTAHGTWLERYDYRHYQVRYLGTGCLALVFVLFSRYQQKLKKATSIRTHVGEES